VNANQYGPATPTQYGAQPGAAWPGQPAGPAQPGYPGQAGYGGQPGFVQQPGYAAPGFGGPAGYGAPAGPGLPGYPGAGAPAPKKRRRWLLPVVLVAVLVVGGCAAGIAALAKSSSGPRSVVSGYLGDVRSARYQEAYDRLCGSLRSQGTAADFATVMKQRDAAEGPISKFKTTGYRVSTGGGTSNRVVTVAVTRNGKTTAYDYRVGKDGGKDCLLST